MQSQVSVFIEYRTMIANNSFSLSLSGSSFVQFIQIAIWRTTSTVKLRATSRVCWFLCCRRNEMNRRHSTRKRWKPTLWNCSTPEKENSALKSPSEWTKEKEMKREREKNNSHFIINPSHLIRFHQIILNRSNAHLRAMFTEYERASTKSMQQTIQDEMSGDLRNGYLTFGRWSIGNLNWVIC